jgi:hypothetical protein
VTDVWWSGQPQERYWLEITGRDDIGTNLNAPQQGEEGAPPHWSYSLIWEVQPGDLVFHWQTTRRAIVGCSRAMVVLWALLGCAPEQKGVAKPTNSPEILAEAPDTAEYRFPNVAAQLLVLHEPMHGFLAEYRRTLILAVADADPLRVSLTDDTGGYDRANLYQVDRVTFRIRDAFGSYLVLLKRPIILFEDPRQSGGTFIGSFDRDAQQRWRFIPAVERAEQPTELRGG